MCLQPIDRIGLILAVALALPIGTAQGQSNVDPAHKFAWGENIGWTNWQHDTPAVGDGVFFHATFLSGYIWGENVGWINVGDGTPAGDCDGITCYANDDGTDFGVNIDADTGEMFGMAWGENIGWINFEGGALATPPIPATVDFCTRQITGYAWGENIGWINLDDTTHYIGLGPCALGDYDCNAALDLEDHMVFAIMMAGPDVPVDCPALDFDADTDLDLKDFAAFQNAFTG